MSSILKALKKLEHEKSVKKPDAFRIDADILRGGPSRRYLSTGVILSAIAIFTCGVGATYVIMRHNTTSTADLPSQTSKIATVGEPSTGKTTLSPVPTPPAEEPSNHPEVHVHLGSSTKTPLLTEKQGRPIQSTEQQYIQRMRTIEIPPQTTPPEPRPLPSVAPPAAAAKPHVLKVDGIAFQDGTSEGVAVVNGVAVSKGSVIEGARVEEIQKDRVRFSRGSEKFEIVLDKSN